jgi:hypothetical protein
MEDFDIGDFGGIVADRLSSSPKSELSFGSPKFSLQMDFMGRTSGEGIMEEAPVGLPAFDGFSAALGPTTMDSIPMPASMDGGHGMDLMDVMGRSMPLVALEAGGTVPPPKARVQSQPETKEHGKPPKSTVKSIPKSQPRLEAEKRRSKPTDAVAESRNASTDDDEDRKVSKRPWSKEEDEKVVQLVAVHGAKNWPVIANHLPGRVGKQCRERYAR